MRPFHWSSAVIGGHRRSSAYSIVKNAPDNKRCGEILGVQRRWRSQSRHQHPTPFQRERFFVKFSIGKNVPHLPHQAVPSGPTLR